MSSGRFQNIFIVLVVLCLGATVYGESVTMAVWDVMGNSPTASSVSVLSTADGVSASSIIATGVNVLRYNAPQYAGVFVANHWSTAETPDFDKYFSWSVTDTTGTQLDAIQMSLSRGKYEHNTDPNEPYGASKWDLYVNGLYVATLDLDNYDGHGSIAEPDEPIIWDVDLDSIAQSDVYSFRLYGYSDEGGSDYAGLNESWYDHQGVNVTLTGQSLSSVPEPLTILSAMMGMACIGFYIKKRKQVSA